MTDTATMTRVECACRTCATNARSLGKSLPLAAMAPARFAAVATPHRIVYMAHNPSAVDRAASRQVGVSAL